MAKNPAAKEENWDEAAAQPGNVRIKCIVGTLPHTGLVLEGAAGLGMKLGEVREVPEDVALLMESRKQVEIL